MSGRLIGLGGHLGAGKDAVADYLVAEHSFVKVGMSDRLLDACIAANPLVRVTLREALRLRLRVWPGITTYTKLYLAVGYVDAKTVESFRAFMQRFGTEAGRNIHGEDVWVDLVEKDVRALLADGKSVALTGVRFPNEVERVNQIGETWYVRRPGHDGTHRRSLWQRVLDLILRRTPATATHASESSIDAEKFDRVLLNDGSLEDLYEKSLTLLK